MDAARRGATLRHDTRSIKIFLQKSNTAQLSIATEDVPYGFSLGLIDHDAALADVVTERNEATHPHAFTLGGGDLVADPLAGYLPFELGERQQYIERQAPHRSCGIELLGYGHEGHAVSIEELDHLGEVGQRAGQPVDL